MVRHQSFSVAMTTVTKCLTPRPKENLLMWAHMLHWASGVFRYWIVCQQLQSLRWGKDELQPVCDSSETKLEDESEQVDDSEGNKHHKVKVHQCVDTVKWSWSPAPSRSQISWWWQIDSEFYWWCWLSSFRFSVGGRRWSCFLETETIWPFRPEEDQRNTKWPAGFWSVHTAHLLYSTVLYCTPLYSTVLYCTRLWWLLPLSTIAINNKGSVIVSVCICFSCHRHTHMARVQRLWTSDGMSAVTMVTSLYRVFVLMMSRVKAFSET